MEEDWRNNQDIFRVYINRTAQSGAPLFVLLRIKGR
jgi:hypothetical protein